MVDCAGCKLVAQVRSFPYRCYCGKVHQGPPRGIGDLIEHAIKWLTRGKLKPCKPCQRRRDRLNRWWRFR